MQKQKLFKKKHNSSGKLLYFGQKKHKGCKENRETKKLFFFKQQSETILHVIFLS